MEHPPPKHENSSPSSSCAPGHCESKDENNSTVSDNHNEKLPAASTTSSQDSTSSAPPHHDPYTLIIPRFIEPQIIMFNTAIAEIQAGQKQSCWSWFILPTPPYIVNGTERGSNMNKKFALRDDNQTKAYLLLETIRGINLRLNYIAVLQEIEKQLSTEGGSTMTLDSLLGPMDASKAISSFRLFERIGRILEDEQVYKLCERVLELVENPKKKKPTPQRGFFRQFSL